MTDYEKTLILQLRKSGFDVNKLPKELTFSFQLDKYARIPEWVINLVNREKISRSAFQLYCNISNMCYGEKSFTWVSKKELADMMNVDQRTVYRLLNNLLQQGAITIFTQQVRGNEKSLIFLMKDRNIKSNGHFIYSKRSRSRRRNLKGSAEKSESRMRQYITEAAGQYDTHARGPLAPVSDRPWHQCHRPPGTSVIDPLAPVSDEANNRSKQGKQTRETNKGSKDTKKFSLTNKKKEADCEKALALVKHYYQYVNQKFKEDLEPRKKDCENAFTLISQVNLDYELFLRYIEETAPASEFFLKSNKHFSVWTSPVYLEEFSNLYNGLDLEEFFDEN